MVSFQPTIQNECDNAEKMERMDSLCFRNRGGQRISVSRLDLEGKAEEVECGLV